MNKFEKAYIVCALWSSTDESNEQGGEPLDANYTAEDINPEALQSMLNDCRDFQEQFADLLLLAGTPEQNGHDFWLTRNGHGAGFWDRGYDKHVADELTSACKDYGSVDIYPGDDGQLYV